MKIDSVYIVCSNKDLYFARICIASVRYWNKEIPIQLIKDYSKGEFDTVDLEQAFKVSVVDSHIRKLGYYGKLYPFIERKDERALLIDADIVWLCDLVHLLEAFDEDFVIDGYSPENMEKEKQLWYFFEPQFSQHYPDYIYPGFFFNSGQMLFNTNTFSKDELLALMNWQENAAPKVANAFLVDQGILNYLVAEKIKRKTLSYRNVHFHLWGWDKKVDQLKVEDIKKKKGAPFLIHWYGIKYGLISFLPGNGLLKFYEAFYYSHFPSGKRKLFFTRLKRTLKHPDKFLYELMKEIYYRIIPTVSK